MESKPMKSFIVAVAALVTNLTAAKADLILTGIIDSPLGPMGNQAAIEVYATADIPDLSLWGVGAALNGTGNIFAPFVFSGTASQGQFLYLASDTTEFNNWFGFDPDFVLGGLTNLNGNDAIVLFFDPTGSQTTIDIFGLVAGSPGDTTPSWDYAAGWAYRQNGTGPDGSTFQAANWSFSGVDALDGETTNSTAAVPLLAGTYAVPEPAGSVMLLAGAGLLSLIRRHRFCSTTRRRI